MHKPPTMLRTPKVLAALLLAAVSGAVASGCASDVQIHTIRAPSAHFEHYQTVAILDVSAAPQTFQVSPRSRAVREYVEKQATEILKARGYTMAPLATADLVLRIESGRRARPVEPALPLMPLGGSPGTTGGAPSPTGGGGERAQGAPGMESYHGELDQEEADRVDGAFVIDAFDGQSHEVVWHGSAKVHISDPEAPVDYERLHKSVDSVLATFPARAGS